VSHTPTLERIQTAVEPLFPIELRFTDAGTQNGLAAHVGRGALITSLLFLACFEGLPTVSNAPVGLIEHLNPYRHGVTQST